MAFHRFSDARSRKTFLLCGAAAAFCILAAANALGQQQEADPAPQQMTVEDALARGELVAVGGGPGGAAAACITCHGENGAGDAAAGFPRLTGLGAEYMAGQLADYADGSRPNDIMTPIAEALSPADREAVSIYYESLESDAPVRREEIAPHLLQQGGVLYAWGAGERNLQACKNCHGPGADGSPPIYPKLSGQHASYIIAQLRLWQRDIRKNDPGAVMEIIAKNMTDEDIEGVAAYLASLEP